jgi:hypothetical protein
MMPLNELALMLLAVMFALFSFSYIFKGWNIFFTTSEHVYLAGNTAIVLFTMINTLWSSGFQPLTQGRITLIIPILIGILYFTRLTRYRWLSRYPVAVLGGIGLGLIVAQTIRPSIINAADLSIGNIMAAITYGAVGSGLAGSVKTGSYSSPLGGLTWGQQWEIFSAVIMIVCELVVLVYFTYSIQYSNIFHKGKLRWVATLGKFVLLFSLGQQWTGSAIGTGITMYIYWVRRPLIEILQYFGMTL